jgi:hypothetical protein
MTPPRNGTEPEKPAAPSAPVGEGARSTASLDEFSRGTLDVVRQLCAALIGRGVLEADSLSVDMKRLSEFWRSKGFPGRAEPAEILAEALRGMTKTKREVAADIFPPAKGVQ